jgi:hypothetical protein
MPLSKVAAGCMLVARPTSVWASGQVPRFVLPGVAERGASERGRAVRDNQSSQART